MTVIKAEWAYQRPNWAKPRPVAPAAPPTTQWTGESGASHEFFLHGFGAFCAQPGVYVFCTSVGGRWVPIYIGETDNFARRIGGDLTLHRAWAAIRDAGATHLAILKVPGPQSLRLDITKDLKAKYKPKCNQV
jgi:hypothetical protein